MKKLATGILVAILLLASVGYAQGQSKPDSTAAVREQQIKAGIDALIAFVGTSVATTDSASATDSTAAQHKTWGGVLEKSLDMFSGAISKIASLIEQAAPHVWAIMVRQQYAKAAGEVAIPFGFLLFVTFYYRFLKKKWTPDTDKQFDTMVNNGYAPSSSDSGYGWGWRVFFGKFLPLVGWSVSGGFLISAIQNAVLYTFNPYYYAIRDILVLLLGSSRGM